MARQDQFAVTVSPHTRERFDVLRIVTGQSRASLIRQVIEGVTTLADLEHENRARLKRVQKLATLSNIPLSMYVSRYVMSNHSGGPTVEELEQATAG